MIWIYQSMVNPIRKLQIAAENIKDGGFKITTSTEVFGENYSKDYTVAAGEDIFALAGAPVGMNSIIWDALQMLNAENNKSVHNTYAKFVKDGNNYLFYETKDALNPYLSVEIEDGKVIGLVYYENIDGKITTYTSVFDYSIGE